MNLLNLSQGTIALKISSQLKITAMFYGGLIWLTDKSPGVHKYNNWKYKVETANYRFESLLTRETIMKFSNPTQADRENE